jgi:hypothetical protein
MPHSYAHGDVAMLNWLVSDLKESLLHRWTSGIIASIPSVCIGKAR